MSGDALAWCEIYAKLRPEMLPAMDDPRWVPIDNEVEFDTLRFVKNHRVFTARRIIRRIRAESGFVGIIEWHDWADLVYPTHFMAIDPGIIQT